MTITGAPHDWSRYSLSDMWMMLSPQSRTDGHVGAMMWQQVQDLCHYQADQLDTALGKLREAWPVTQAAAAKFQDWASKWATAMRATSENAKTNGPIIDTITHEIDAARSKVAGLMDDAVRYEKLGEPMATIQYVTDHAVHGDWTLSDWRAGLTNQAREIMANLEQKVATYAGGIAMEQPFTPELKEALEVQYPPVQIGDRSGSVWSGGASSDVIGVDGFGSGALSFMDGGRQSSYDGTGLSRSSVGDTGTGDTLLASTPVLDLVTGPSADGRLGGVGRGRSFVDTPVGRVLAPGGLVGAPVGPAVPGVLADAAAATRSGNMPMAPPIMTGQGAAAPSGAPAKGGGKRRPRKRTVPSIFEVRQGGPDVILPSEEADDHDPGPNVFGIDL
jgi:hypothetical protein